MRLRATTEGIGIDIAGLTDCGWVREHNQDQFLIADLEKSLTVRGSSFSPEGDGEVTFETPVRERFLVVADGVGGQQGGEVASEMAIQASLRQVVEALPWFAELSTAGPYDEAGHCLARGVEQAHREVLETGAETGAEGMATTLTLGLISWPRFLLAHVGDSRAYLLRRGTLRRLTRDHTLVEELKQTVGLSDTAARRSPWQHVVTRAVGGSLESSALADVTEILLAPRDVLLLCSDGLTGEVDDTEIADCLSREAPASRIAHELVHRALGAGGRDNVTVIVAKLPGVSDFDPDETVIGFRNPQEKDARAGLRPDRRAS